MSWQAKVLHVGGNERSVGNKSMREGRRAFVRIVALISFCVQEHNTVQCPADGGGSGGAGGDDSGNQSSATARPRGM